MAQFPYTRRWRVWKNMAQSGLNAKTNAFDDFIAAAEYSIQENITTPEYLAIRGGSNGGLLVELV